MAERNPADIARDTLKLLATRRLAPTPQNYQTVYEEVAGLLPQVAFPIIPLRRIASMLPTQTPAQKRITQQFVAAVQAQDWTALQAAIADYAMLDLAGSSSHAAALPITSQLETIEVLPPSLAEQLARVIENMASALGDEDQRMREMSLQLVDFLRIAPPQLYALEQMLGNYSYRLSFTTEDQAQRRSSIHALLRMVSEHILSIAAQDAPLQQQAAALSTAMQRPWTRHQLDIIQTHLKNLLFRHLEIEGHRTDAHAELKHLLARHSEQMLGLGRLGERHAQALQQCAEQLEQTQSFEELASALHTVVESGQALVTENRIVQAQLEDLRQQVLRQEAAISELSSALDQVQDTTRHDPETGALNIQGLQEMLHAEAARVRRQPGPISLAVLQLDTVDMLDMPDLMSAAMTHLARLARCTLRPQDAIARTGPKDFALLFPATPATTAAHAMGRLQTELSQQPLLHQEKSVALSFSAGVIQVSASQTVQEALQQATQACQQAQHMGMARVALG